jgi:hypothetical protein
MKKLLITLAALIMLIVPAFGQTQTTGGNGVFVAARYGTWSVPVAVGNSATGSATITLYTSTVSLTDGTVIMPFSTTAPITINDGASSETVTPTAVSGCSFGALENSCQITASFSNTHGRGTTVQSGTFGLQESINAAFAYGGGVVIVDAKWGGANSNLTAAVGYHNVSVEDRRSGVIQYWNLAPNTLTVLATPTALTAQAACDSTHTFCSDSSTAGTWTSGTLYGCVAYVDIMGNEGPCSTTANFTTVVSKAVDVGAPAASTGAVGYTVYLSLIGGSYAFAYKVPITSSICTLTRVETVVAACAVTNATYGQTGSNAQVAAVTVNTAQLALQASTISATTDYVGNHNGHTVYSYMPSNHIALPGVVTASVPFPIAAAAATTVPAVLGTLTLPAGYMNFIGKEIEICGYATQAANGSTATISSISLWWDAAGSNAAGVPVKIADLPITNTMVTAKTDQLEFCADIKTTVAGASATAGSILQTGGHLCNQYTSSGVATVPLCVVAQGPSAIGSLNLAGEARIHVVYLHTTGTDANGYTLNDLHVKELN